MNRTLVTALPSVILAALVSFVLGASAAPAQDAQAAALLAKHRAYVGWQLGDGTFQSLRITGNVTNEKGEITSTFVLLSAGIVYNNTYTATQRGNLTEHEGFTGYLFWQSNINGFTTPIYGDYARYLASATILEQEGTAELPATFVANKTIDGKSAGVVRVTLQNGDPIDLAIDPDSGAFVEATIDPGGAYETTYHIRSYRDLPSGKRMVGSYTVDDSKSVIAYTKVEPNVQVSTQDFHPPVPTAQWTFAEESPVPITLTHDRILVEATVNGVKGRFILDTGADAIVLNDRFADRVGAKPLKGRSEAETLYGSVPSRARSVETIAFGGASLKNVLVYSQDFEREDWRGLDETGYDGLIGFDLFAGAVVKLDTYGSKLTIMDPATDTESAAGIPLLVDLSEGVPTIPMTLNKSMAVNAMLDTGNPGQVFYDPALIRRYHLIRGCQDFESLAIGPIVYPNQTACEASIGADVILLGFDFFKHFDFIFDYPRGRMVMMPNKN